MAELTPTTTRTSEHRSSGCCSTDAQATCCEPSDKAACCGTSAAGGSCGCAAGQTDVTTTAAAGSRPDIRETVREKYAAAARQAAGARS